MKISGISSGLSFSDINVRPVLTDKPLKITTINRVKDCPPYIRSINNMAVIDTRNMQGIASIGEKNSKLYLDDFDKPFEFEGTPEEVAQALYTKA